MSRNVNILILISLTLFASDAIAEDIAPVGVSKVENSDVKTSENQESASVSPLSGHDNKQSGDSSSQKKATDSKDLSKPNTRISDENKPTVKSQDKLIKSSKKIAYTGSPNSFNRLMKPPSKRNLPPAKDGIHDPNNDGTHILQAPKDSFDPLPKSNSGNRVDWVRALENGDIQPRFDRLDPEKKPIVLDLNIVREVKGSMPDVVYPHKQHTEWLDCSNCHPAIFIPMKGANNISMASILLGEKCGVCHGKVAFPVSECRKCHSKNKSE